MIIALIIAAIIFIVHISKPSNTESPNKLSPFEITFISRIGQDPVSYIRNKLSSGSDLGDVRYLFEIVEAEVEKKSNSKSLGFDFYYTKAMRQQGNPISAAQVPQAQSAKIKSSNMTPRHRWTMADDILCCRRFFEQYVIRKSSMNAQFFSQQLHKELPYISVGSLKMKAQNIQQLCDEHGIKSSFPAKPLTQYSQQNRQAFMQVKRELGIENQGMESKR